MNVVERSAPGIAGKIAPVGGREALNYLRWRGFRPIETNWQLPAGYCPGGRGKAFFSVLKHSGIRPTS